MDKEFIIDLLKELNSGQLSMDKCVRVLTEYCIEEHNKSVIDTNKFINSLLKYPFMMSSYIDVAIEYYKRKYNICSIYSKEGKLLQTF